MESLVNLGLSDQLGVLGHNVESGIFVLKSDVDSVWLIEVFIHLLDDILEVEHIGHGFWVVEGLIIELG